MKCVKSNSLIAHLVLEHVDWQIDEQVTVDEESALYNTESDNDMSNDHVLMWTLFIISNMYMVLLSMEPQMAH